jgi:chromosome segregation ATPase
VTLCSGYIQERDGYKAQVESLRDKISELSRNLAEGTDTNEKHVLHAAELQAQITALQAQLVAKEELVAELEARLTAAKQDLDACHEELEDLKQDIKRQLQTWKIERAQMTSDRDGYKGQVGTLRDKVLFAGLIATV